MTVIAEVVRSGFVECQHHGSFVVLDADGGISAGAGRPDDVMLPRSSNKPLQAAGMLHAGLELPSPLLALAAASHTGEAMHTARVERILATAGLGVDALRCPAAYPSDEFAALEVRAAGKAASPLYMNCSGKHAAMLATCVINGWSTEDYYERDHPLQRHLAATVSALAGEPISRIAVDGCGAPIFALTLTGLARAFQRMVLAAAPSAEAQVVAAFRAHPLLVAGSHRADGLLGQSLPELFAKAGAEGVYAAALPDGRAFAVRTDDGARRSTEVVAAEILLAMGQDSDVLRAQRVGQVLGRGQPVGEVRLTSAARHQM